MKQPFQEIEAKWNVSNAHRTLCELVKTLDPKTKNNSLKPRIRTVQYWDTQDYVLAQQNVTIRYILFCIPLKEMTRLDIKWSKPEERYELNVEVKDPKRIDAIITSALADYAHVIPLHPQEKVRPICCAQAVHAKGILQYRGVTLEVKSDVYNQIEIEDESNHKQNNASLEQIEIELKTKQPTLKEIDAFYEAVEKIDMQLESLCSQSKRMYDQKQTLIFRALGLIK
ncbi:MAG: hypothetical protein ACMXYC_03495 [Candidatus Woesearchaeota archaeon]